MCVSVCADVHDNDLPRRKGARERKRGYTLDFVRLCMHFRGVLREASCGAHPACLLAVLELGAYLRHLDLCLNFAGEMCSLVLVFGSQSVLGEASCASSVSVLQPLS